MRAHVCLSADACATSASVATQDVRSRRLRHYSGRAQRHSSATHPLPWFSALGCDGVQSVQAHVEEAGRRFHELCDASAPLHHHQRVQEGPSTIQHGNCLNPLQQSQHPLPLQPDSIQPPTSLPRHLAVILDGNARWAAQRGLPASAGHEAGAQALTALVALCCSWHIPALTVYAFSQENWGRPRAEVTFLLTLMQHNIEQQVERLREQGVRLMFIGDRAALPVALTAAMARAEQATAANTRIVLTVAVNYSGQADMAAAAAAIAGLAAEGRIKPQQVLREGQVPSISQPASQHCSSQRAVLAAAPGSSRAPTCEQQVDAQLLEAHLATAPVTALVGCPDLLIRTSGEQRLSNFLLFELAYAELVFCKEMFPDFDEAALRRCLQEFSGRQRRFGKRGLQQQ
ncbi:hypothetical protein QJQ45_000901 [Haematococcus lacustris]|nr:hypothetical protein QJQ45_000901 [Haematococcus lacustris]